MICISCGKDFRRKRHKDRPNMLCSQPCWWTFRKSLPSRATPHEIRRLRDDEPIPAGTPRRYRTRDGYTIFRWKVGRRVYVEALEHRVVAGRDLPHVHHKNRDRMDNRPENLQSLTPLDHGAEHATVNFKEAAALYNAGWSLPKLGRHYGVHTVTVMRGLKRRGVVMRAPGHHHRALHMGDLTYTEAS